MTIVAKPRELLLGDEKLGTSDDGLTLSKCAQRLSDKGKSTNQPVVLDWDGLDYKCDNTITVERVKDFTFGTASGGRIWTDTAVPPGVNEFDARERAHIEVTGAVDSYVKFNKFDIVGPKKESDPNTSPDKTDPRTGKQVRDMWEQQAGLWIKSVDEIDVCGTNIERVWGDCVGLGFVNEGQGKPRRFADKATIKPGRWYLNGRIGLYGQASNILYTCPDDSSYLERIAITAFSIEDQGAGLQAFENIRIKNLHVKSCRSFFCMISGLTSLRNVSVEDCLREDGPVNVQLNMQAGYRAQNFRHTGNFWNKYSGGKILNIWATDGVTTQYNHGVRSRLLNDINIANCTNVVRDPNYYTT